MLDIITAVRLAPRSLPAFGGGVVKLMTEVQEHKLQLDRLPLRQAVFQFGALGDPDSSNRSLQDSMQTEAARSGADLWLEELERVLREKAHANEARIDPVACTFRFSFNDPNSATCIGTSPWVILENSSDKGVKVNPRVEAEALFNKEGLVYIADDEGAAFRAQQLDAIRHATGLVWRQFMLPAFDRAVSWGRIVLCARIGSTSEPFREVPPDVWSILNIVDWRTGTACDPQSVPYYSIHAAEADLNAGKNRWQTKKDHSRQGRNNLLQQVQEMLEARYRSLDPSGPKPIETDDEKYVKNELDRSVPRADVLREARRAAFSSVWGIELKRGRRNKK